MRNKEEHYEQVKVINYLKILERQGKVITFFAVPNGGSRHKVEAVTLKAEGVRKGVSDLVVLLPNLVLFLEMKRRPKRLKNGKLSTAGIKVSNEQMDFLSKVNMSNIAVGYVAYGFDEAKKFIDKFIERS
jgi:hypothetical protein